MLLQGTAAYENFTSDYWSAQQNSVDPYCVFKPSSAIKVSAVVLLSRLTQCPFAVKGGGHAAFAGGSSIQGGITVALEKLDEITLSSDKKIAAIGPGNRWGNVYKTLEQYGLEVIGGRVSLTLFYASILHLERVHRWETSTVLVVSQGSSGFEGLLAPSFKLAMFALKISIPSQLFLTDLKLDRFGRCVRIDSRRRHLSFCQCLWLGM